MKISSAIIDSKLFYGVELTCRSSDTLANMLAPIYNNAIRTVSGLLPSTPADAACIEIGSLPFFYKLAVAVVSKAVSFLETTRKCRTRVFLLDEANRLLRAVANESLPSVATTYWTGARCWRSPPPKLDLSIKRQFKAGDNNVALRSTVTQLLIEKYHNHTQRFTDGSKAHGLVGVGVYGRDLNIHHRLPDMYSVFSAEIVALFLAASHPSDKPVVILTDSASAIFALNCPSSRHPWIQAIQQILDNGNDVTFVWIPGHCGVQGNESADQLASLGRSNRRYLTKEVPGPDAKKWVKHIVRQAWTQEWWAKREPFIRKIKGETIRWNDTKSLKDQQILSRLRTGHTRLTHNMAGGSGFHKNCDICGIVNTVEHTVCVCPKFDNIREHYNIGSIGNALNNDPENEEALIGFLKDAGLYGCI